MRGVAQNVIEQLQKEVQLSHLLEQVGIQLEQHDDGWRASCPFHDDVDQSLYVDSATGHWRCKGPCQCGGTVIDWVMKVAGVSARHAVELLQNGYHPDATVLDALSKRSTVKRLDAAMGVDMEDARLLLQVVEYYHQTLLQSPEAMNYLQKREIASADAVVQFKIGYANRTLGYRLPDATRVAGARVRAQLQTLGIVRESGHEHFTGALTFPIFNEQGEVVNIYARKVRDNLRIGTQYHLTLTKDRRGLWNSGALHSCDTIILCQSLIDALTFWCAGFRHVTATLGRDGWLTEHQQFFHDWAMVAPNAMRRVLIAYRREDASESDVEKRIQELVSLGIECYRIDFSVGMDANEFAIKNAPATESLGGLIRKASFILAPAGQALKSDTSSLNEVTQLTSLSSAPFPALVAPVPGNIQCEQHGNDVVMYLGDRRYRIRGLQKNHSPELMKVNIMVSLDERMHIDTFDFYIAKARATFATQAAAELRIKEDSIKQDLGRVLLKLEELQAQQIKDVLAPKVPIAHKLNSQEHAAAMELLCDPQLIDRILDDFETCGIVGERTNKLVGYLVTVSRKLDHPLGSGVQSSSAAGKTSLLDAVLAFVPDEDRVKYSAMTGQSLFYMGETNLKHKVLAIVEEEGASRASYALKLLQSEGELMIASTGKDPQSGNLVTQEYRVEGPVALFFTTTARDIDEELLNRCLVLTVDESRAQTKAVHTLQRERRTLEGLRSKHERIHLRTLHQNAQRLLKPIEVLNPYAKQLTFPDQSTRLRRDHEKYLTLIDTITLLHQHQRSRRTALLHSDQIDSAPIEYIEVTLSDIALANQLAHEVLGRSLDELPPQTRRLLRLIDAYVVERCKTHQLIRSHCRFTRRMLREAIDWGDTQLRVHLERLVELEYLLTWREGAGGKFVYELVYETGANDAQVLFPGLIDVDALKVAVSETNSSERSRGVGGSNSVPLQESKSAVSVEISSVESKPDEQRRETRNSLGKDPTASYPQDDLEASRLLDVVP